MNTYNDFCEFLDNIYDKKEENFDYSMSIGNNNIYLTYNGSTSKIEFRIAFLDNEKDNKEKLNEDLVNKLDEIAKTSDLQIKHVFNDAMGCPFVEEVFTINIEHNNKYVINNFVDNLLKEFNLRELGYSALKRNVKFRPKARLLSILGEQLISNEIVAIKELVLNAYDADAENVNIDFIKDKNNKINKIMITDDGNGMNEEVIIKGWFTPATSLKTKEKKSNKTPRFERQILGEKGVGRFACRRLGSLLDVKTRKINNNKELFFNIEWAQYDVEEDDVYLDEIDNNIFYRTLTENQYNETGFDSYRKGTCLLIKNLRDNWDDQKINELSNELKRLVTPFDNIKDFSILINGNVITNNIFLEKALYYLESVIDENGFLYYILGDYPRKYKLKPGEFSEKVNFDYDIEEQLKKLDINYDKIDLKESKLWKTYIKKYLDNDIYRDNKPKCGKFKFNAFAWDLDRIHTKFVGINDRESKQLLKKLCGVSIYRDGFRVWPYGSEGNDWLNLDRRAQGGNKPLHIANHQVIGYVEISQKHNAYFRDKSNREGFIEDGDVFEDFKSLVLATFSILEQYRYINNRKERAQRDTEWWSNDRVIEQIDKMKEQIDESVPQLKDNITLLKKSYVERKQYTENRISNLLEISSSGIVFESVTHELISFLNKIEEQSNNISKFLSAKDVLIDDAIKSNILLHEALKIVLYEVKEMQPFFKAARYQQKELNIKDVAEKSLKYFKYKLKKNNINYNVVEKSEMKRKAVEGFILQIFTNLIDNSIYWLGFVNGQKDILITVDGKNDSIYFSDSGIGIDDNIKQCVFDPFFTQKEIGKGRGLGLYIVRELLANYRGKITVSEKEKPSSCSNQNKGASFEIIIPVMGGENK